MTQNVSWPTWKELQSNALIVVVASVIFSLIVFVMDTVVGISPANSFVVTLRFQYYQKKLKYNTLLSKRESNHHGFWRNWMKLASTEDLGFTILLGPPSKEEVQSQLRTTIPHSSLTLRSRSAKRKKLGKSECESEYWGTKSKKANYFRNSLFSFCGPSWARTSDHLIMSQVL